MVEQDIIYAIDNNLQPLQESRITFKELKKLWINLYRILPINKLIEIPPIIWKKIMANLENILNRGKVINLPYQSLGNNMISSNSLPNETAFFTKKGGSYINMIYDPISKKYINIKNRFGKKIIILYLNHLIKYT